MCGIVGAIGSTNIVPILTAGLKRLEYRGYDSCGIAVMHGEKLTRVRSIQRVAELETQIEAERIASTVGIAHTRWATHGAPAIHNAHPHFSNGSFAVVHNGIIENHEELREELKTKGFVFVSQTDTEVIVHLIADNWKGSLGKTVRAILPRLRGAYAIAVMSKLEPGVLIGARQGSPLVLGINDLRTTTGSFAMFLASDALALAGTTDQIVYLEEGDVADLTDYSYTISNKGVNVEREVKQVKISSAMAELGKFQHYMQKEIFEQPVAIANTVHALSEHVLLSASDLAGVERVLILACGTSYYSGCVAKYWIEEHAGIPCHVEIASEYRYRKTVPSEDTLVVCISQSGETADTIAALKHAKSMGMAKTLTVCNVATSAMVRECKHALLTAAGAEIGVASTKAFTTQLIALLKLTMSLMAYKGKPGILKFTEDLMLIPDAVHSVLALELQFMAWADRLAPKHSALFLGRGSHFPIAQEGALKLKEISYIHAEAYAAGELKHGPLALVTSEMPVIVLAPNDEMIEKLKSNIQEVKARKGELFVLADRGTGIEAEEGVHVIHMPLNFGILSPILHVVALQLIAYHTALKLGNDVDKPRNLAKSVTVE